MSIAASKKMINFISLAGVLASVCLSLYFYHLGIFKNVDALQGFVGQAAFLAPFLFILIQILQVIIPIIPGGISLAAGVLLFGPLKGFIYNYAGICIGSVLLFLLGRQYGKPLVLRLVNQKIYERYIHWTENQKRFDRLFALAIFLPVAPDDALCLIASLTEISVKKFTWIILLAKPASVYLYSLVLLYGGEYLIHLFM
ncbi:MAG TPA: VTT domain-containing protein [Tetragenococcus sp.]|nr:VTT domain-containing protein [Tetragenococcus sp.]